MPRKLVNRFFWHCPPKVPRAFSGWQRSIQSPQTEASFRPQAHHSGAGAEPHLPSPKGHISQNHINSSGLPKSTSLRYVQQLFEFLPQAGRSKHFLAAKEQITKDPWVLQVVSGYQIEFLANPVQRNTPPPIPCSLDHQTIIDQEV